MEKVGSEGVITVEELKTIETTLDVVEGMPLIAVMSHLTSPPIPKRWRQ